MGSTVSVHNRTGKELIVLSFNNTDILYKHYTDKRLIPVNGKIDLDGLPGGNAVKVGVVYDVHNRNLVYDLFRVPDKAKLIVKRTNKRGVKWSSVCGVELLMKGKLIQETADQAEAISYGISTTFEIATAAVSTAVALLSVFAPNIRQVSKE